MVGRSYADQSYPPSQAQGEGDDQGHRSRQCRKVRDPGQDRACVRASEKRFGLFMRTIGIKRAEAKLTLANLAYNFDRLIFHERRAATV